MRVAIVTESFLPHVNGVSHTVRHVADRLLVRGDQPLVVAPGPGPDHHGAVPVVRTRSVGLPGYRSFPLGIPDRRIEAALADFRPDVVHLASPIAVGALGLVAARRLGVPTVAVYQTDVAGFARQYGVPAAGLVDQWTGWTHRRCDRTLAPSTASLERLVALGVAELHLWRRGVALDLFGPHRRDEELVDRWRADGTVTVGHVGRLAAEKQVRRLAELTGLRGVRLVVIGDGPERAALQRRLPDAVFTGMLGGDELARAFASLDLFVHPGESETFCQTVQEAQASGVPVIAPACGGPLDLVEHGVSGLLYDTGDPTSLRRAVRMVANDPLLRRRLARGGLRSVAPRSWARVVDELVDVHYRAVLGGRADARAA